MRRGDEMEAARALLEAAATIDPTCQAVYLLGEWHLASGDLERALSYFSRYMDLDPVEDGSYLKSASILERRGRTEEARAVLRRGLDYLTAERERQVPRPDPEVPARFNTKAIEVYEAYGRSVERLSQALSRLEAPPLEAASPAGRR
jgi:tetratricopeptide (TPR) repeat protein